MFKDQDMLNREGYFVTDELRECTKCGTFFENRSKTVTLCNQCNSERVKSESSEVKMWRRAKSRAKLSQMEFNIEVIDIVIPKLCPVFGIELISNVGRSGGNQNSPALDRIDNTKGYIKGNIQVISHLANQMKASANSDQLIMFAKWVNDTYQSN
jgi:predicted  nucleic acid-binding Zn-ribbon protein